ncbi:hypothetical protein OAR40_04400 [Candidatus Pelagibacter sp.]|nr:hypothetical protein [Candidatus Pelagibacter sp.]
MKNTFDKIIRRTKDLLDFRYTRKSFSQFGEDLIIESALNIIKEKIIELMLEKNYKVFADTRLNTIFIDENRL